MPVWPVPVEQLCDQNESVSSRGWQPGNPMLRMPPHQLLQGRGQKETGTAHDRSLKWFPFFSFDSYSPEMSVSWRRCHPSSHMYYCTFCSSLYRWLIDWLADSLLLLRTPLMFPSPSFTSIPCLVLQKDAVDLNGPLMKYVYDRYMILSLLASAMKYFIWNTSNIHEYSGW